MTVHQITVCTVCCVSPSSCSTTPLHKGLGVRQPNVVFHTSLYSTHGAGQPSNKRGVSLSMHVTRPGLCCGPAALHAASQVEETNGMGPKCVETFDFLAECAKHCGLHPGIFCFKHITTGPAGLEPPRYVLLPPITSYYHNSTNPTSFFGGTGEL